MSIKFILNGTKSECKEGINILEACKSAGIEIPNLCYHPLLQETEQNGCCFELLDDKYFLEAAPLFSGKVPCKICIVEVQLKDEPFLTLACCTKVKEGMVINTDTEKVIEKRKLAIERLWACCPEVKILCDLAEKYGVEEVPFSQGDNNCLRCGICIKACKDIIGADALGFSKNKDRIHAILLKPEACIGCGLCYDFCPTGAINPEKTIMEKFRHKPGEKRICRYAIMGLIPFAFCSNNYHCADCEVDQRYRIFLPAHPALFAKAKEKPYITEYLMDL